MNELLTYADNVPLPAFAMLLTAGRAAIDISCSPGPQQQICAYCAESQINQIKYDFNNG